MGSVESRIGVVAFHEKVIADNEILLSMYNKTDDLLRAIDNIKLDNSPSGISYYISSAKLVIHDKISNKNALGYYHVKCSIATIRCKNILCELLP